MKKKKEKRGKIKFNVACKVALNRWSIKDPFVRCSYHVGFGLVRGKLYGAIARRAEHGIREIQFLP